MSRGQALVVGATSAIGRAIAVALVPHAERLVLWGRDEDRLARTATACAGVPVSTRQVEATDPGALADGLDALRADGPLTTVVWAAGVFDWAPAAEADPAAWRSVTEVNLTAPAVFTALVLPDLVAAAPSALVYLGSAAGHTVYESNAAYVASKHGLAALARATYLDVRAARVKVSLVAPGLVDAGATDSAPLTPGQRARLLTPEDVAAAVTFVVGFPDHGCPTEIRLQPHQPG